MESGGGTGGEAVAAESLLNLHSTPARPSAAVLRTGDSGSTDSTSHSSTSDHQGNSIKSNVISTNGLLAPPEITPRPRPIRARSFIQPFAKSRPDALSRSLSSSHHPALDDPFAFSPVPSTRQSNISSKKRRNTVASPSPLQSKRKKDSSILGSSPRIPLSVIRPNSTNINPAISTHITSGTSSTSTLLGNLYMTPVRPDRAGVSMTSGHVPSSLNKMWVLSSPGHTDAAASLGLVPGWGGLAATPGMQGCVAIGGETPGAEKNRREDSVVKTRS